MQFLTPATLAIAAGLTIPPLVALYFLKLKRQVHPVSSTLLWKKAIEDLHVNAPFQKLRSSLLLLLQLLILVLGALALGQPMVARRAARETTLILMIDQSASMAVVEDGNQSRLDIAKTEAKRVIDGMDEDSRAMVIAFCDRATVVSSFDTDREALKRKIDTIEQTDSTSTLSEAVTLAEAYSQNLILGGASTGSDVAPSSAAPAASVIVLTDGRIEDAEEVSPQRIDLSNMEVVRIGGRSDNVGIVTMDARRTYEAPEVLQVFATVRNFGEASVSVDASLYINDEHVDVQGTELAAGMTASDSEEAGETDSQARPAPPGSVASIAFDAIEYEEGGVVEIRLSAQDALEADNRAWTVIQPPRRVDVLFVSERNAHLRDTLGLLNVRLETMTPEQYESASDDDLMLRNRGRYDVVVFDRYSTARLPTGNYFFWGCAPKIEGVEQLGWVDDEIIIDWDETHPVLRHARIGSAVVDGWERIRMPSSATILAEGETEHSNVLSYFARGSSRYLICAFSLVRFDEDAGELVTVSDWFLRDDFGIFVFDAVEYLASTAHTGGLMSLRPGEPTTVGIPGKTREVTVERPDGGADSIPAAGGVSVTYARTRRVGTYEFRPAIAGQATMAVNLFSAGESFIAPQDTLVIGASPVAVTEGHDLVNQPLWKWAVLGLLFVLVLEWIVYNKRVFV